MATLEEWTWYLNIAVTLALVVRLAVGGFFRVYRVFSVYLLIDTLQQILRWLYRSHLNRSAEIYMAGQALKLLVVIFVILELYKLALEGHPALAKFGRNTVGYVLLGAAAIAAPGLILGGSVPNGQSPFLHRFFAFERTMDVWDLVFLLLICGFMVWFPIPIKRNVALYLGGFAVFFFARSASLLLLNVLDSRFTSLLSVCVLTISFLCVMGWLCLLRREGEYATTVVGHGWNPAAMERLTNQLESINSSVMRFSRR